MFLFLCLNRPLVGPGEFSVQPSSCRALEALDFLTTLHTGNALIHQTEAAPPLTGRENLADYLNFSVSIY